MKRNAMKRRILNVLKNWQGSALTMETADEILKKCEDSGMLPPVVEGKVKVQENKDGSLFVSIWEWEK
jgi:hypothetical protein